jgi:general secretion pathway protein A
MSQRASAHFRSAGSGESFMDSLREIVFYGEAAKWFFVPDSLRASVRDCSLSRLAETPRRQACSRDPNQAAWTTVSSYPSMGAGVSFRVRPFTHGPVSGENYFAFRENPFSLTPNPRFLYRTRQAHETLGRLTRGILERRGLILLCGPVGTGKTTLLYSALHLMDVSPAVHNKIGTAMIVHPTLTRDEFLETVLDEFDVECRSNRRQWRLEALLNMLLEVRRRGGVAVLVIDEAQMLSAEVLEEVKALLTLQTSHEKLLQIVLCGQPELEGKLEGMTLRRDEPFVAVRCGTAALSLQDTYDYVQHRLRIAGARSEGLFMPAAVDAVHLHTGGIPRLINVLCGQALSVASEYRAGRVFPYMVDQAAGELCSGALVAAEAGNLLRSLPLLCDGAGSEQAAAGLFDGVSAAGAEAAAKMEHGERELAQVENTGAELAENAGAAPSTRIDAMPDGANSSKDDDSGSFKGPGCAGDHLAGEGSSLAARSSAASPGHAHSKRGAGSPAQAQDDPSGKQAARRKRRALRHRAKFAHAVKSAQGRGRPVLKCDFSEHGVPGEVGFRRSAFRPSPFRREKSRVLRVRLPDLRELGRVSVADIAGSLPAWNLWLNRWCSEHFTSKSCGKPLFQLGLAGTLFLALAQVIVAGFPRQHLAHVAFGFIGLLFIDISLGLGTYLLLIERRLTPSTRASWTQTLRRRLG